MVALQSYDVLAVRAAINALVIVWAKTPKGRRKLNEAIALLQAQAMAAQVMPIDRRQRTIDRELLQDGVLYLEAVRELIDVGRV